jgi:hypothetical protein
MNELGVADQDQGAIELMLARLLADNELNDIVHSQQTAMEETIAPTNNLIAHAIRNRLQTPRSQAIQDTAEEPTKPLEDAISRMRRARFQTPRTQETQATTEEPTIPTDTTFSHLRALRNRFRTARTQPCTTSTDTWRFFPGRNSSSQG